MSTEKRDIVEHLRAGPSDKTEMVRLIAATEITRLRSKLAEAREALQEIYDYDDGAWACRQALEGC